MATAAVIANFKDTSFVIDAGHWVLEVPAAVDGDAPTRTQLERYMLCANADDADAEAKIADSFDVTFDSFNLDAASRAAYLGTYFRVVALDVVMHGFWASAERVPPGASVKRLFA